MAFELWINLSLYWKYFEAGYDACLQLLFYFFLTVYKMTCMQIPILGVCMVMFPRCGDKKTPDPPPQKCKIPILGVRMVMFPRCGDKKHLTPPPPPPQKKNCLLKTWVLFQWRKDIVWVHRRLFQRMIISRRMGNIPRIRWFYGGLFQGGWIPYI